MIIANYSSKVFNSTPELCQQMSGVVGFFSFHLKTYFCEKSRFCYVYYEEDDIECDGIVNCPHGEDEEFVKCKARNVFPKSATIECHNIHFPRMTILATPCNNVTECLDGSDEYYCGLDDKISQFFLPFIICFFIILCLVLTIVIVTYAKKRKLLSYIFVSDFVVDGTKSGIKGDALATLKVTESCLIWFICIIK